MTDWCNRSSGAGVSVLYKYVMDEERLPNRLLFWELNMKSPCHWAKKRWRDVLKVDLQAIGVYDRWYELCQERK